MFLDYLLFQPCFQKANVARCETQVGSRGVGGRSSRGATRKWLTYNKK
jgi:hypothetical protein